MGRRERLTATAVVSRRLAKLTLLYYSTFLIVIFKLFTLLIYLQPNNMHNMDNGRWSR